MSGIHVTSQQRPLMVVTGTSPSRSANHGCGDHYTSQALPGSSDVGAWVLAVTGVVGFCAATRRRDVNGRHCATRPTIRLAAPNLPTLEEKEAVKRIGMKPKKSKPKAAESPEDLWKQVNIGVKSANGHDAIRALRNLKQEGVINYFGSITTKRLSANREISNMKSVGIENWEEIVEDPEIKPVVMKYTCACLQLHLLQRVWVLTFQVSIRLW